MQISGQAVFRTSVATSLDIEATNTIIGLYVTVHY